MRGLIVLLVSGFAFTTYAQAKTIKSRLLSCAQISQKLKKNGKVRIGFRVVQASASGCKNGSKSASPATFKDKSGNSCTVGWTCGRKAFGSNKAKKTSVKSKNRKRSEPDYIRVRAKKKGDERHYSHTGKEFPLTYHNRRAMLAYAEKRYAEGYRCIMYGQGVKTSGTRAKCVHRSEISKYRKYSKLVIADEKRMNDAENRRRHKAREPGRERYYRETSTTIERWTEQESGAERQAETSVESSTTPGSTIEAALESRHAGNEGMHEGFSRGDRRAAAEGAREDGLEGAAEQLESGH